MARLPRAILRLLPKPAEGIDANNPGTDGDAVPHGETLRHVGSIATARPGTVGPA